jgi:hypothetical protein
MEEMINKEKILEYSKDAQFISITLAILLTFLIDLIIGKYLIFWITPLIIGLIVGILLNAPRAGVYSAIGAMLGRFFSILILGLTTPGLFQSGDLFLKAIEEVLGFGLPPGMLVITIISVAIIGILSLFSGLAIGALMKILREIS